MRNERLASVYATAPFETRLLVSLVEALAGPKTVEEVMADLEAPSLASEPVIEGRPLRAYSGMTEDQLKAIGLSPEGREEVYSYYERSANPKVEDAKEPGFSEEVKVSSKQKSS